MTTPPATHPASYCPDAAHTLQWGVRPDSTTQGWILARQHDDGSSVVAVLDGYPHGRTPVPAGEAREWADRILGAAQEWVEQPARSGAYHRHGTVVAAPAAVPPTDRAAEATAEHHVVDGVKYLCHAGDHYCPAEPHRLALSEALGLGTSAPWDAIRERAAELAGHGAVGDRAAVLREAADLAEDVAIKRHGQHEIEREQGALDVMTKLRRLAAETPGPETQGAEPWLTDSARIGRTLIWSWADVGKGAFREGYRAAQAEARALLGGERGTDQQQPAVAEPGKESVWCSAVALRVHHAPHDWEPQPGMTPVHCGGHPAPAATPPGKEA